MELFALKDLSTSDPNLQEVEVYYLKEILQKGKFSTRLLKASSSESDGYVAIKLFPKSKAGHCNSGFLTEVKSVMKLSHPNLVKYHTFYKDALIKGKNENLCEYSALVMEYISQGDLFQLVSKEPLPEKFARTLFRQMISVIEYLHEQSLTHLDIKLENFLMTEEGIKLIDFDGCQDLNTRTDVSFPAGTAGYRPPEFVKGGFQDLKAADIYSLGIVLFTMITGTPPYTEIEENNVYKFDKYYQTLRSDTTKFWRVHEHYRVSDHKETFSQDFKQLIEGMLAENPCERLSIEKIKRTKWFKGDSFSQQELNREIRNVY